MIFQNKPFFITITNKFTGQFHKEFLIDGIEKDSVIQTIISVCNIDPLSFNISAEEASLEQANSWIEDKFPNGESKHNVVDKDKNIVELLYNPMGNPYG
tara:strand:- start:172 stop:468 length:297 start_codon:yes stop_codon:yes gene_type:complete